MSAELFDARAFGSADEAIEFLGNVVESCTEYTVVATDSDGAILLWNEGARRLYGYAPHEIVGRSWTVLHTERDAGRGLPQEMADRALRDGKWEGTVERVRKDGSSFMAHVVTTPRHTGGRFAGFVLISSDISEQVRLNRELEGARSLLEFAPDAMVLVNAAGEIKLTNAETARLFGYAREELIGHPVEMLIPERYLDRHPEHRAGFFNAPQSRPMGAGLDLWGRHKDGTEFPVEISLGPVETEDGILATAAIRDVTEHKRAEGNLRDANVELEAAGQAKDRFLTSMSHELRTPLNAILGFTGMLLMELPGPLNHDQANQLRTVENSGKHLLSLINDLLDLARIESGKLELHVEPIEALALLEEVADALRPLADEKGLDLEVVAPPGGVELFSDRRALRQILINLSNNAIKFTDEGRVSLELSRQPNGGDPSARFSVVDTGRGIAPEDQEQLFAAFGQIGSASAQPYEGTGLGLYICQTLAPLLGGTITFESELGRGTSFNLQLRE